MTVVVSWKTVNRFFIILKFLDCVNYERKKIIDNFFRIQKRKEKIFSICEDESKNLEVYNQIVIWSYNVKEFLTIQLYDQVKNKKSFNLFNKYNI